MSCRLKYNFGKSLVKIWSDSILLNRIPKTKIKHSQFCQARNVCAHLKEPHCILLHLFTQNGKKQVYCHEINSVFFSLHPKAICIYSLNLNLLSNFKLRHPIELSVRLYESHLKSHNDLRFTSFYFHLRICF